MSTRSPAANGPGMQYTNSEVFVELQGVLADAQAKRGTRQPAWWPQRKTPLVGGPPPASLGYRGPAFLGPLVRLIKDAFPLKKQLDPNAVAACKTIDNLVTLILGLL